MLRVKDSINPDVVLIGDSITHFWGGEPKANHVNGLHSWESAFGKYRTLNLGFGCGPHPERALAAGPRRTGRAAPARDRDPHRHEQYERIAHARQNTPAEIAKGVGAILRRIRAKAPHARIILMAVFPREQSPNHPRRAQISEINNLLAPFGKLPGITFLDIGPRLLQPDGTISREIMADFCHPTDKGYQVWADALRPLLAPDDLPRKGSQ